MTDHKHKYPNMDDAKIEALFHEELRDYYLKIRGDYDSMLMYAITLNIGFPLSLEEIFTYIKNSIK